MSSVAIGSNKLQTERGIQGESSTPTKYNMQDIIANEQKQTVEIDGLSRQLLRADSEETYVHLRKTLAESINKRGLLRYLQVEFDTAESDYSAAIQNHPQFPAALYNRGTVRYRMGNFSTALEDFKKAVELDPTNEDFILGLSRCEMELNKS